MATIDIQSIEKSFGALKVLKSIDIHVEDSELLVLVGPSGCGKSTLLSILAGLEASSAGRIRIGEDDVTKKHPRDRDIAMVFQSYALYPTMTVRQNISFGLEMRGVPKAERQVAVEQVASLLQITQLLERKPSQLSGGQRQRVAMGRALVRRPEVFLLDEPLSNLDAKLRVEMRTEIKKLHARLGKTMIYVTHDQIEAMTLASRIVVMKDGEVQQIDVPRKVYDEPANLFVASFIGSPQINLIPLSARRINGQLEFKTKIDAPDNISLGVDLSLSDDSDDLVMGIRPEDVRILSAATLAQPDEIVLPAIVDVVEPTGSEDLVALSYGTVAIQCKLRDASHLSGGEAVHIAFPSDKAKFFDASSGQRLAATTTTQEVQVA